MRKVEIKEKHVHRGEITLSRDEIHEIVREWFTLQFPVDQRSEVEITVNDQQHDGLLILTGTVNMTNTDRRVPRRVETDVAVEAEPATSGRQLGIIVQPPNQPHRARRLVYTVSDEAMESDVIKTANLNAIHVVECKRRVVNGERVWLIVSQSG